MPTRGVGPRIISNLKNCKSLKLPIIITGLIIYSNPQIASVLYSTLHAQYITIYRIERIRVAGES